MEILCWMEKAFNISAKPTWTSFFLLNNRKWQRRIWEHTWNQNDAVYLLPLCSSGTEGLKCQRSKWNRHTGDTALEPEMARLAKHKSWKQRETADFKQMRPLRCTNCREVGEPAMVYVLVVLHLTLMEQPSLQMELVNFWFRAERPTTPESPHFDSSSAWWGLKRRKEGTFNPRSFWNAV